MGGIARINFCVYPAFQFSYPFAFEIQDKTTGIQKFAGFLHSVASILSDTMAHGCRE
jgi:hypothetical protein